MRYGAARRGSFWQAGLGRLRSGWVYYGKVRSVMAGEVRRGTFRFVGVRCVLAGKVS